MTRTNKGGSSGFSWRLALVVAFGVPALCMVLYGPFSQWWNDLLHAQVISQLNDAVAVGPEERLEKVRHSAVQYNSRFMASRDNSDYLDQLDPFGTGAMGRIKIEKINVDLPIYHTSSDAVLRKGAGHMEETTLPVGGVGTHAAITAHRGLAESKLFTDLDQVDIGDTFTLEILGEPLVYQVEAVRIVDPTETSWLVPDPMKDQVTLITCDPLGINSERMLVTGSRIDPTPVQAYRDVGAESDLPGFPMWIVYGLVGLSLIGFMVWSGSRPRRSVSHK